MRIAAWGQTSAHLPHWMQTGSVHTGICSARLRFSQRAVPTGKVPSTGIALTGRWSPLPPIIRASTFFTNSGASSQGVGVTCTFGSYTAGTFTSCRCASAWSIAS
jgi:hypothetical protein